MKMQKTVMQKTCEYSLFSSPPSATAIGLHTAIARTPVAQGFTIGANQCRLLRLVGWGGVGVGWDIGWGTPNGVVSIGLRCNQATSHQRATHRSGELILLARKSTG